MLRKKSRTVKTELYDQNKVNETMNEIKLASIL